MNILIQLQATSIVLVLALASIHAPAQSSAANTVSIVKATPNQLVAKDRDLTDVSIGGIKIGMSLQQVINKLGKPITTSQRSDPCLGQKRITLRYPQMVISVLGDRVLQIENSNPLYQTGEKIKIGDPLSKAKNTYDKLLSTPSSVNGDGQELLYDKSADGILRFKSKQGKIISISIIVNDC
jgi:hypothetical protein